MVPSPRWGEYVMEINLFKKGDLVIVDFGQNSLSEKGGVRPAVVVSNNYLNNSSPNIIVAPMTNSSHKKNSNGIIGLLPSQVYLSNSYYKELNKSSILQLEDIRSISQVKIIKKIGELSAQNYNEVNNKLKVLLDLN